MSNKAHDLISRKALIEAIESITWYSVTNGSLHEGANSKDGVPLYKAEDIFKAIKEAE